MSVKNAPFTFFNTKSVHLASAATYKPSAPSSLLTVRAIKRSGEKHALMTVLCSSYREWISVFERIKSLTYLFFYQSFFFFFI